MAWTEKLASGKYRGGWRDPNDSKHYTRRPEFPLHPYDRKSDALKAAKDAESKAQRVAAVDHGTLAASVTWGDWWDQSCPDRPDSDTGSREANIVEKYLRPRWGETPLNHITRREIQRWVTDELAPGKAASYVHRIYSVFRGSLTRALDQEILDATPCERIKLPKPRKGAKPYVDQPHLDALTQPSDGLMALSDPGHRALVAVAYETGLRPGELCGMHVDQVNLDTGWIEVTHVYVLRLGMIRGCPKDKDYRRVPLTSAAAAILKPLLAERGTQGCGVPHTDGTVCKGDLVFRSRRGTPINQDTLGRAMQRASERAGVAHKSAYALRRGAFTWMAEARVDPFFIAKIAGHASLDQTAEYVQETSAARDKFRAARGEAPGLTVIQGFEAGASRRGLDYTPDWRIVGHTASPPDFRETPCRISPSPSTTSSRATRSTPSRSSSSSCTWTTSPVAEQIGHSAMRLTSEARDTLRAHDVTQAQWIRRHFGADATTWHGDACGCPDDRCIGFHHDAQGECGCLPALLSERGEPS